MVQTAVVVVAVNAAALACCMYMKGSLPPDISPLSFNILTIAYPWYSLFHHTLQRFNTVSNRSV